MFLWTDLLALTLHPFRALPEIDRRRHPAHGALALGLSVLVPAILAELAALGPYRPPASLGSLPSLSAQGLDIYARWVYQHRFRVPVVTLLGSLLLWIVAGLVIHAGARALHGRGDLMNFLKLIGFVALVGLVATPVTVLDTVARLSSSGQAQHSIDSLTGTLGLTIFVWQNVLLVMAAQAHYGLSTGRAVTAVLGPIGCLLVLGLALLALVVIAAALARPAGAL
ncbi:MAG: YIP1 family protein [Candidatus Dormibacter sp.]